MNVNPSPNFFVALWIGWAIVWSLAALRSQRTISSQLPWSRIIHLGLFSVGMLLLFVHVQTPALLGWQIFPVNNVLAWVEFALATIGIGYSICARMYLGKFWSGTVTIKEQHELVRSGPYRFSRHPIYTGLLLAVVATALQNASVAAAVGVGLILLAIVLKIRLEETVLQQHFGAQYSDYSAKVRCLVPLIRRCEPTGREK
jgi:protein-S-isoprenylcysteine O-methyltransferase Ste14